MAKLIAIVDDEPDILNLLSLNLKKAGFSTQGFSGGESLFKYLKTKIPDLIILDLMLSGMDGFDICKYLKKDRKFARIPIVMLTAKGEETDKILGLELGADDYITKPFSPRELVARVKAVLRRQETREDKEILEISEGIIIDLKKHEVSVKGAKIDLTRTEFKILLCLSEKKGWVFSRDQILDYLWGEERAVLDRTIDVHIKNLRDKMGKTGDLIKNIRGVGYKLEA